MTPQNTLANELIDAGNEHFQMASRPGRVLFWSADRSGHCELVSDNWPEQTGQPMAEALGDGWLNIIPAHYRQEVTTAVREAVEKQRGFYLRYPIASPDGRVFQVLHDASARTLPSGKFNGLIGTLTDETDSRSGLQILNKAEQQVYEFLDEVCLPALAIDPQGMLVQINDCLASRLHAQPGQLLGSDWVDRFVCPDDQERIRKLLDSPHGLPSEIEYLIETPAGPRLYRWHLTRLRDNTGKPANLAMMGSDITRWRQKGNELRLTAQVFDSSMEAMVITDCDNKIVSVNAAFTTLTGYSREEAIGQNPRLLQSNKHDRTFYLAMWQSILKNSYWRGDIWDRRKDGSCYPKFLAITAIRNEFGEISNYSAIFYDVSERKRLEERLENLAHYDALTQLPNRTLLQDRLEQALLNCDRLEQQLALLFIDLDGFKPVNDQFGHAFGDEVLKEVARRLNSNIRAVDTAARLGGDEFVVVLGNIGQRENAEKIAHKLIATLAMPYCIGETQVTLGASIGISLYPEAQCPASELLRLADEAMYVAKKTGKGRYASSANAAKDSSRDGGDLP